MPDNVAVQDPTNLNNVLKPNADGSINISGSIVASNPSVGTTNAAAPTSATELGIIDAGGKLQGVSATNPLPISGSFSASFTEPVLNIQGTASSAAVLSNFPLNPTTGYRTAAVQVTSITAGNTLVAEESNDGTTWYGIQTVGDTAAQSATPMTAVGKYIFPVSALQFRVRLSVFSSGSGAANVELRQNPVSYAGAAVAIQGTPTVVLGAGSAVVGNVELVDAGGTNKAAISAAGAVKVDGSAVTQPVSGTVTANAGTNLNTSALALETGGNLAIVAGAVTAAVFQSNTKQVNGVTTLAGAGAVGTGAQRVAVGQDTTTIAGSAPGTAGTPSANVVSVQGAASMTPVMVQADTSAFQSGAASATGTSSTQVIAAVSLKRIYVTSLSISNSSATPVTVALQDGSGGTTLWTVEVPAGGGNNIAGPPLCRTSSGVGLFFAASGSASTIYVNAAGFSQ